MTDPDFSLDAMHSGPSELKRQPKRIDLPSGLFLTFNDGRHTYERSDGEKFRGTGAVMRKAQIGFGDKAPTHLMENGARRHKIIEYYNLNDLDESSVDEADRPYLDSWRAAVEKYEIRWVADDVERLVAWEAHRIATLIDVVALCNLFDVPCTVNLKSGQYKAPSYGVQMALEAMMWRETCNRDAKPSDVTIPARVAFYLKSDGKCAEPVIYNDGDDYNVARWALKQ